MTVPLNAAGEGQHLQRQKGAGVLEYKVSFGPGYRVYFGRDGQAIVILLGGGTKQRQADDIASH